MTDPDDTKNKSPKHQQATIKIFKNLKNRPGQKTRVASNQERTSKLERSKTLAQNINKI